MDSTTLQAAIRCRELGISTIPTERGTKRPPKGFHLKPYLHGAIVADEHALRDWFDRTNFGLGIICGRPSGGLVVRDFDTEPGYADWAARHPDLARSLPTVQTKRCAHVYFRGPLDGVTKLSDGELRGTGAYVIAPPSLHPEGGRYAWLRPISEKLPEMDPALFLSPVSLPPLPYKPCMCPTVGDAIKITLPKAYGQRNDQLFALARHLKGLVPNASAQELRGILQQWHRLALPNIRTKGFAISWLEFQSLWKRVERPAGRPLWSEVVTLASMVTVPAWASRHPERFQRLIVLCSAANQAYGGAAWPLSCRWLAKYLGVGHDTAARMLQRLVIDQVLEIAAKHPQILRMAHEYRWIGGGR
jgi:hypothetical protein